MANLKTKPQWPIFENRDGIPVAVVPLTEYERLVKSRFRLASIMGSDVPARRPTSRIFQDAELAEFVDHCLVDRLTYAQTRAECISRFGLSRAPSKSAIGRYSRARE